MNHEMLLVFLLLLLGLILCTYLGSFRMFEGMENANQAFYGPSGASAEIQSGDDGQPLLVVTTSEGTSISFAPTDASATSYSSSNGATAKVVTSSNGDKSIIVTLSDGTLITYNSNTNTINTVQTDANTSANTSANTNTSSYDNYNHFNGTSYPTIFYGPDGGTARVIKTPNNNTIVITYKNGTTDIYYIDKSASPNVETYYGKNGGTATMITGPDGKQAVEITGPNGSKIVYTGTNTYTYNNANMSQDSSLNQYDATTNSTGSDYNEAYSNSYNTEGYTSSYYNSLPKGIPRSQIPQGEEDLYILKSQVVPPVCPKCPDPIVQCPENNDVTKCPPCPPCARCPEPNFTCEKVPNYKSFNPDTMPVPVLSDFSTFGL